MPMSRRGVVVMATAMFMALGINFTVIDYKAEAQAIWGNLFECF